MIYNDDDSDDYCDDDDANDDDNDDDCDDDADSDDDNGCDDGQVTLFSQNVMMMMMLMAIMMTIMTIMMRFWAHHFKSMTLNLLQRVVVEGKLSQVRDVCAQKLHHSSSGFSFLSFHYFYFFTKF